MNDKATYKTESLNVSFDKKLFNITNYQPQYTENERRTVSADVENQLLAVFQSHMKKIEADDV